MRRLRLGLIVLCLCTLAVRLWAVPVRVLATGDMHGWMESATVDGRVVGGAAEMLAYWKQVEGYDPRKFVVVSAGDNSSGPAISTIFRGNPVVAVMNLMGYDATAVGNHEFDFTAEQLPIWRKEAHFPFLAANLTRRDGTIANYCAPYTIVDAGGVKVGIIGLTTRELYAMTANAGAFTLLPYADAVRAAVPQVRAQGAQTILLLAHAPQQELVALAEQLKELRIPLMIGGHSHELAQRKVGNTWVVNSGEWWRAYSRIDLDVDPNTGTTLVLGARQVVLSQARAKADPAVRAEIARWQRQLAEYRAPVAYSVTGLKRDPRLYHLITACWLAADPVAEIALTNDGSLRQDLPAGVITRADIIGLMPFVNSLYRLTLTGDQLLSYLPKDGKIGMAGLRYADGRYLVTATNAPIDRAAQYHVVMNNYMHLVSPQLQAADPSPVIIADDWRAPVLAWLAAHPTDANHPLEAIIPEESVSFSRGTH